MPANKPEDLHTEFARSLNAGDLEALLSLYEEDAVLVAGPGGAVHGKTAIREVLAGFVALKPNLEIRTVTVLQGGGDLAALEARWTLQGTAPDGSAVQSAGASREVARRQTNGAWLYVIDDPGTGR